MCTRGKRLNLFTGILCMLLVVMIAVSKSKSMSLNEHSSDDGIEDEVSVLLYTLCTFTKCRIIHYKYDVSFTGNTSLSV